MTPSETDMKIALLKKIRSMTLAANKMCEHSDQRIENCFHFAYSALLKEIVDIYRNADDIRVRLDDTNESRVTLKTDIETQMDRLREVSQIDTAKMWNIEFPLTYSNFQKHIEQLLQETKEKVESMEPGSPKGVFLYLSEDSD